MNSLTLLKVATSLTVAKPVQHPSVDFSRDNFTVSPEDVIKPYYGDNYENALNKAQEYANTNLPSYYSNTFANELKTPVNVSLSRTGDWNTSSPQYNPNNRTIRLPGAPITNVSPNHNSALVNGFRNIDEVKQTLFQPNVNILGHELNHQVTNQLNIPLRGYTAREGSTSLDNPYMTMPAESIPNWGTFKREHYNSTNHLIDSPEAFDKAIQMYGVDEADDVFNHRTQHLSPEARRNLNTIRLLRSRNKPDAANKILNLGREWSPGLVQNRNQQMLNTSRYLS